VWVNLVATVYVTAAVLAEVPADAEEEEIEALYAPLGELADFQDGGTGACYFAGEADLGPAECDVREADDTEEGPVRLVRNEHGRLVVTRT
jgi:hypothetical protein